SRHNTARIACALAAGIESAQAALQSFIPKDPHRGGGAALHAGEDRVLPVIAGQLPPELPDAPVNGIAYLLREDPPDISKRKASLDLGLHLPDPLRDLPAAEITKEL